MPCDPQSAERVPEPELSASLGQQVSEGERKLSEDSHPVGEPTKCVLVELAVGFVGFHFAFLYAADAGERVAWFSANEDSVLFGCANFDDAGAFQVDGFAHAVSPLLMRSQWFRTRPHGRTCTGTRLSGPGIPCFRATLSACSRLVSTSLTGTSSTVLPSGRVTGTPVNSDSVAAHARRSAPLMLRSPKSRCQATAPATPAGRAHGTTRCC